MDQLQQPPPLPEFPIITPLDDDTPLTPQHEDLDPVTDTAQTSFCSTLALSSAAALGGGEDVGPGEEPSDANVSPVKRNAKGKGKQKQKSSAALATPTQPLPDPSAAADAASSSSPTPIITDHDRSMVDILGIVLPMSSPRAGTARDDLHRGFHNDAILASHVKQLEDNLSSLTSSTANRNRNVTRLVEDYGRLSQNSVTPSSFDHALRSNEQFTKLCNTVAAYGKDVNILSRAVNGLRHDLQHARSLPAPPTLPAASTAPTYYPPQPVDPLPQSSQLPYSRPPVDPPSSYASTSHAGTAQKRPHDPDATQQKRPRWQSDNRDVLIQPVARVGHSVTIAHCLLQSVPGFKESDMSSATRANNITNVLSIRFLNQDLARSFVARFMAQPPEGMSHMTARQGEELHPPPRGDLATITGNDFRG